MVLVVEDDAMIVEGLKLSLTQEGYRVRTATTKAEALAVLNGTEREQIQVCLLDVMLPDGNGYEICSEIRRNSSMPILFLTACDDEVHTVLALEQGADDYITKPFHIRELMARMKAVLRRTQGMPVESVLHQVGANQINLQTAKVYRDGQEVVLTAMEYKLLLVLLRHRGQLLSRQQLLGILWDDAGDYVNDNTLTVYMKRLRNKLDDREGTYIETVRGMGYRLRSM
ncbi:MAG: response regulator transcription factor [Lachnospiraceae bacterium]|nr:response regulator transcription factor [Lachnospiraceae bacterium]